MESSFESPRRPPEAVFFIYVAMENFHIQLLATNGINPRI